MKKKIEYALDAVKSEIKLQQSKDPHGLASVFVMVAKEHLQEAIDTRPQPATDSDMVERVARAMWDAVPSYGDVTFDEARDVFIDSKEWQDIISQYLIMSHAALAAMQPAIDKAVAEERASVQHNTKYEG